VITVIGLAPVIGEPADLINAGISGVRSALSSEVSHAVEAGLNASFAISLAGYGATATKVGMAFGLFTRKRAINEAKKFSKVPR
ncbi:MAG: hypothetical protein AAFO07_26210, partial [Bacteroidota bacterium]